MDNSESNGMNEEMSFAEMFEASQAEGADRFQVGDKVQGTVISISKDTVFVDAGTKVDGIVDRGELEDDNGELTVKEGDPVELYVVSLQGGLRLSKALSGIGGMHMLQEAFDGKLPVEGKVKDTIKGGFHVELLQRRAFCPVSQIDAKYVEDPSVYVGETLSFLITKLEQGGRNIVVSRRSLLEREYREAAENFFSEVSKDEELDGTVTRIMPYGAFVELAPGVEGMVHVSEMSWSRAMKPEDIVSEGDRVRVKILGIEQAEDPTKSKISLTMKQLSSDPWDSVSGKFKVGEVVTGTVTRLADFGAFVEIAPGIEGLVHISEMSYVKRIHKPEDVVKAGEQISVSIKEIDPEKRRISLSLRDAEGDPWADISEKYKSGTKMNGTVEKHERFGIFVNLEPGVTGLMPNSRVSRAADPSALQKLKSGDPIAVVVEEVKAGERRITLGPADARETEDWREHAPKSGGSGGSFGGSGGMGLLGEKLQQAMKAKKK